MPTEKPQTHDIAKIKSNIQTTMDRFVMLVRKRGETDKGTEWNAEGAFFKQGETKYSFRNNISGEGNMRSDICVVQETLKDPGIQLARWFKGPPAERGIRQDLQYVASVPDTFFVSSPEEWERLVWKDTVQLTQAVLERFEAAIEVMKRKPTDSVS